MKLSYRQSASGSFTCNVADGTPHCGPDARRLNAKWNVIVEWLTALDSNGFLMDNLTFREYFRKFFADMNFCRINISCESLARLFAGQVLDIFPNAISVEIAIYPLDGVGVEVHCTRADLSPCSLDGAA